MACTGAMWRMLRVGRILICVHTTNKDCLLLKKVPRKWRHGKNGQLGGGVRDRPPT